MFYYPEHSFVRIAPSRATFDEAESIHARLGSIYHRSGGLPAQPFKPSATPGSDGVIGWLLSGFWKPSSAGFRHGEFWS
jgi:hypothetical protein